MTPKEMVDRVNALKNRISDLEEQMKDSARECKQISTLLEELPSEIDEIEFTETDEEEETTHTEDFEPTK